MCIHLCTHKIRHGDGSSFSVFRNLFAHQMKLTPESKTKLLIKIQMDSTDQTGFLEEPYESLYRCEIIKS